jgi:hypothetical protein
MLLVGLSGRLSSLVLAIQANTLRDECRVPWYRSSWWVESQEAIARLLHLASASMGRMS